MNDADVAHFESQAAETVGAMKELFTEFERRLGEVVAAQRLAASEARDEGVKVRVALEAIARQARALTEAQRQAIDELRGGWRMHVAENSKAAGEEMALRFGQQLSQGLMQRLERLGDALERVTRRFEWTAAAKWGLVGFFGCAVVLSVAAMMFISAVTPTANGLTDLQVREAVARMESCRVGQQEHTCVLVDDKVQIGVGPNGKSMLVIRGM